MNREHTVKTKDLKLCMQKIQELRRMALNRHLDPWAVRQALIFALIIDTHAALKRGFPMKTLDDFDQQVKEDTEKWIQQKEVTRVGG
jgi:hypothetical protein